MEIKPIKTGRRNYPTLQETLDKPELLEKNAPARWLKNGVVAGALGVFLLYGCNSKTYTDDELLMAEKVVKQIEERLEPIHREMAAMHRIAPIFVHGNGVGAIGCIVRAAPVYISEEEANNIIVEEFLKKDIEIDTNSTPMLTLMVESLSEFWQISEEVKPQQKVSYSVDGINKNLNLIIEYISKDDSDTLSGFSTNHGSVTEYLPKLCAERLRKKLIEIDGYHTAIFYDPIENVYFRDINEEEHEVWLAKFNLLKKEAYNTSIANLKAQVADFIVWAKKEGLIK